jgi:hypothetical protein
VEARHSSGDFGLADLEVSGNGLVREVAFDKPQQLELGAEEPASQLFVREPMYPG